MKNGMIRIGMFEAYLERMLIRGISRRFPAWLLQYILQQNQIQECDLLNTNHYQLSLEHP